MMQYQQNCVENEYYQCIWALTLLPSSTLKKKKKEKSIALFPKSTEDKGSQNTHRMLVRNSSTSRLMYELCCGRI